ncbi:MAG TPA: tripeptidyl peptidase II, partial [bacterium]|nr:tripeptidyl peptidase II [bacterium]
SATGLRFDVSIAARGGARGIYLREPGELIRPTEVSVGVDPSFRRDVDNREKVDFQMQASLAVDADWVQVPAAVHLHGGGRNFRVLVDPRGLEPGAHYAEITGTDLADPGRGPVFRVPVTVVVPGGVPADDPRFGETLSLRPGQIHRRFLAVPEGATWADIMVRSRGGETERHLVLHTVQLEPGLQYDLSESQLYAWVAPGEDVVRSIPVLGGRTLEVTVAHYWSSLGQAEFEWDITFHGLVPTDRNLFLDGAHPSRRTAVTATLRDEVIEPEAKLTRRRITLRPADWELRPLPGDRDLLPEGKRIHELVLTYEFEREKAGRVLPVSTLNDDERFWEYWESGLWMILDEGKQRLFTGPVEDPVILPEGKYTLRYQLRHHDVERLEGTVAMPLHLDEELTSPITLAAFSDAEGAFGASASLGSPGLVRGEMRTFWISSPSFEKLPEGVESGNLLLGTITYGQERPDRPGAGRRPGGYPLAVRVPTEPVEKKEPEAGTDDEKGGDDDRLAADVHDTMLELLARLRKDGRRDDFDELFRDLGGRKSGNPELLAERMRLLDGEDATDPADVVTATGDVLAELDRAAIAEALGADPDPDDAAETEHRKDMEERRDLLVEALRVRACALLEMEGDDAAADFEETYRKLDRWSEMDTNGNARLLVERERRRGRPAVALQALNGRIEEDPRDRELLEMRSALLAELGWPEWVTHEEQWLRLRLPGEYPPF